MRCLARALLLDPFFCVRDDNKKDHVQKYWQDLETENLIWQMDYNLQEGINVH